ncbi:MAG: D-aminoacylase [Gammaproteobacteria bacterium]|nr:D-aminoacylase [Gammaproteobacteria bacterium]MDH3429966.1 D-aminoacylase [Gammaproteobacteria bacterium]MDH3481336.1 D-aminoacylase [Gammaproteobacteria bacterium]
MFTRIFLLVLIAFTFAGCSGDKGPGQPEPAGYDLLIVNGTVYDGLGGDPYVADVAIRDDRIAAIGRDLGLATRIIDASGLAVAPGFINMLSWATESLIEDGRSQSDIRQGVTLEVMGEGWTMGPLSDSMKVEALARQGDIQFEIAWTSLGEYLQYLEDKGISTNVASFVGATTLRIHEVGYEDRPPTDDELQRMRDHVRTAMEEGALGVGSSLIYPPAFFAETSELIALCEIAAEYGGRYISHIRSEGSQFVEAVDELIAIARAAGIDAEIYHLKAAGEANFDKLETVFRRIEDARAEGLDITANMYTYTAGATGLGAAMPPWVQEGGYDAWAERLRDPAIRARLEEEITTPSDDWENLYLMAGGPENMVLAGFKNPELKPLTGKTLAEVADMRRTSPITTMMDLVVEDGSRVGTIYFIMSEENIRKKIAKPWMAFGSDAESLAPEGNFLLSSTHPRAYGTFARLLGKYVRDEQVISLQEAIRRLTSLPADNLKIRRRGVLQKDYYADVVIFDPQTVQDHATFAEPHKYSSGVQHVLVNGVPVLMDGEHTGATPGRFLKGPGYAGE